MTPASDRSRIDELNEDLHELERMQDELLRADTEEWENEHMRSKANELQWVSGWIKKTKELLKDA